MAITQEEFNTLMAQWLIDNGGQYNCANSGAQIDAAVTAVRTKEAKWDALEAVEQPFTIPADGWADSGDADWPLSYTLAVDGVTADTDVRAVLDIDSAHPALYAGVAPVCKTAANAIIFWARSAPAAALTGTLYLNH